MEVTVLIIFTAAIFYQYGVIATESSEEFAWNDRFAWNGVEEESNISEDDQARLSGGRNATITKYPFMASILVNNSLTGGGIILNRRWLVTGAYAASFADQPSDMVVRVGSASSFRGGFTSRAKRIVKHPLASGYRHDFALVQLERRLPFSKLIRPIKIGDRPPPRTGTPVLFTAFGDHHPHHHPHQKDFGSPLIYRKTAIGVFSGQWHDKPAVFVDLTQEKSWILKTIKKYH